MPIAFGAIRTPHETEMHMLRAVRVSLPCVLLLNPALVPDSRTIQTNVQQDETTSSLQNNFLKRQTRLIYDISPAITQWHL